MTMSACLQCRQRSLQMRGFARTSTLRRRYEMITRLSWRTLALQRPQARVERIGLTCGTLVGKASWEGKESTDGLSQTQLTSKCSRTSSEISNLEGAASRVSFQSTFISSVRPQLHLHSSNVKGLHASTGARHQAQYRDTRGGKRDGLRKRRAMARRESQTQPCKKSKRRSGELYKKRERAKCRS